MENHGIPRKSKNWFEVGKMQIEKAHLYVEKYNKQQQELWLDFIREEEFLYFRNFGDYMSDMHPSKCAHTPTMLLIHGCAPKNRIREGMVITVHMNDLLELHREFTQNVEEDNLQSLYKPALVFLEIDDGARFAHIIDADRTSISNHIPKTLIHFLQPSWNGSPCALENLGENFELRIWNVGQGSTNSIFDQRNLTLFDFGASIHYSKSSLMKIVQAHEDILKGADRISLIISHWDCDHYNLLCNIDDDFLQKICCVFYPPAVSTLTAKQVAARIEANCRYRVVIPPEKRAIPQKCGMQVAWHSSGYTLFTGENSQNKNLSGLLLTIHSGGRAVILAADHSNYQVWNIVYNHIPKEGIPLHVIVPHHGGYCGKIAVQSSICPGTAAVSVGSNPYGHPLSKIIAEYRNANYKVLRTDYCNQDIII